MSPWFALLADGGWLGVDLFFILSGFVLSLNYASRFDHITVASYSRFLWLRLARVYPVHVFAILVFAVFHAASLMMGRPEPEDSDFTLSSLLENLLLVHAWHVNGKFSWNYPSWSVSLEWLAYLAFPFIIWRIARLKSWMLPALAAFSILVLTGELSARLHNGAGLVKIVGEFLSGCLIWAVWARVRRAGTWRFNGAALPVLGLGLVLTNLLQTRSVPFLGMVVLVLALDTGLGARILGSRLMVYGGRVSYSQYMMHAAAISACHVALPLARFSTSAPLVRLGVFGAYIGAILLSGMFVFHVIEEPMRERMRRVGTSRLAPA